MGVDYSKLPKELQDKLAAWEQNGPAHKQLVALEDLSATLEQLVITLEQGQTSSEDTVKQLGAVLVDMRTSLASLDKRETPEAPDYASPVVEAVHGLEMALTAALAAIEVKPEFTPNIHVDAPTVSVTAPSVDLSGVERVLKSDLPSAFRAAISAIPEAPQTDLSPLALQLEQMSEQLASIDTAARMKPQAPNQLKVTNPDGTYVGASTFAKRVDTTSTANTIYVGAAALSSATSAAVWQMKKIDTTNGADVTWADGNASYDNVWDNRTSLTYS